jgi:lysophospholipase L1-like esterase
MIINRCLKLASVKGYCRRAIRLPLLIVLALATLSCAESEIVDAKPTIDPSRYEAAMAAFTFQDSIFPPPEGGVVFVGSSTFRIWNQQLPKAMAPLEVIPRGFGGSTLKDVLHYADKIITPYRPRALVVYEGDNDISTYDVSPEAVRDGYLQLFDILQQASPGAQLYVVSIKPSINRVQAWPQQAAANELLKALCDEQPLMTYIDTASRMFDAQGELNHGLFIEDGVHLNGEGYRLWREVLREVLLVGEK